MQKLLYSIIATLMALCLLCGCKESSSPAAQGGKEQSQKAQKLDEQADRQNP